MNAQNDPQSERLEALKAGRRDPTQHSLPSDSILNSSGPSSAQSLHPTDSKGPLAEALLNPSLSSNTSLSPLHEVNGYTIATVRTKTYPPEKVFELCKWGSERFNSMMLVIGDRSLWLNDLASSDWNTSIDDLSKRMEKRIKKREREGQKLQAAYKKLGTESGLKNFEVLTWGEAVEMARERSDDRFDLLSGLELGIGAQHNNLMLSGLNTLEIAPKLFRTLEKRFDEALEQNSLMPLLYHVLNKSSKFYENTTFFGQPDVAMPCSISDGFSVKVAFAANYMLEQVRLTYQLLHAPREQSYYSVKIGPETEKPFDARAVRMCNELNKYVKDDRSLSTAYFDFSSIKTD